LLAFTIIAVALTCIAKTASAQSDDEEARRHFRLGEAHYANGSFTEAAREFDEAYRLSQRPQLLYNVYVAYRDAGMVEEATRALREYLTRMPDAEGASNLRARLTAMERTLEERRGSTGTGTEPPPDESESTSTGAEPENESTGASPDGTSDDDADAATSSSEGGKGTIGWVIAGVGGALVIGGAIAGGLALGSQGALQSNCPDHVCPPGYDYEGEISSGRTLAVTADILVITGAVAIVGGVVLALILGSGGGSDEASVAEHASIACGPTGCVALLGGEL
jgi:hypothetical protein